MLRTFVVCSILVVSGTSSAFAQSGWGVVASVTPEWKAGSPFDGVIEASTSVDISGSDFSIGIANGSDLGGDWGVSFIRQAWRDGSTIDDREIDCENFANGCFSSGEFFTFRDVTYTAFLIHKFAPFVTIAERVQIGMNFAGGLGKFDGTLERREFDVDFVSFPPGGGRPTGRQRPEVVTNVPVDEELFSPWPLGKIQVAAAVLVAPGVKIRVAGGLDFPGTSVFSLTGLYLFGGR